MTIGILPRENYLTFLSPEVRDVHAEFWSKVFELPFVADSWKRDLKAQMDANPGDYMRIIPPVMPNGLPGERPDFLNTDAKVAAWVMLEKHQQATLAPYIENWGKASRRVYEQAMLAKERWDAIRDAAIAVSVAVRDLPSTIVGAAGDIASSTATTALAKFLPFLLIAGLGFVAFIAVRTKLRE